MSKQPLSSSPSQTTATTSYRKIELQSPTDLSFLQSLATSASHTKLNTAFPTSSTSPDDALRSHVASLMDDFLARTYAGVRANVTANGVDLAALAQGDDAGEVEEFEPFDAKLAEKIRALEERKEQLTERVADLRRTGPGKAADRWRKDWEGKVREVMAQEDGESAAKGGALMKDVELGGDTGGAGPHLLGAKDKAEATLEIGPLDRWEDVQQTYDRALSGLVDLKEGMSGTVGKLTEAKRVGEELGG
jgi:kinetochor protein Mis14/NSL1